MPTKLCIVLPTAMILLVAACGPSPTPVQTVSQASVEPVEVTTAATEVVSSQATLDVDSTEPDHDEKDECLSCHRDQTRLIETAAPPQEKPDESSGVG